MHSEGLFGCIKNDEGWVARLWLTVVVSTEMNEDASASASASAQNGEDHATGATDDAVSSTTGSPSNRINIVAHVRIMLS